MTASQRKPADIPTNSIWDFNFFFFLICEEKQSVLSACSSPLNTNDILWHHGCGNLDTLGSKSLHWVWEKVGSKRLEVGKGVSKCCYDGEKHWRKLQRPEPRRTLTVCVYAGSLGAQCEVRILCELSGESCRAQWLFMAIILNWVENEAP